MDYSMNEWWASLTVVEKERIASKVAKRPVAYPECTVLWNGLNEETQQKIHDHWLVIIQSQHNHAWTGHEGVERGRDFLLLTF